MNPSEKTFDCLAFKDRVQGELADKMREMAPDEQRRFLRRLADQGPFAEWLRCFARAEESCSGASPPPER